MEGYKDNSGFNAVFSSGGGGSTPPTISRNYGTFQCVNVQNLIAPLSPQGILIDLNGITNGISGAVNGTISFSRDGVYMLEASIQFSHSGTTTADNAYVWLEKSGVFEADSTRVIRVNPNINQIVLSVSYMVQIVSATDTCRFMWSADTVDVFLAQITPPTPLNVYPAASSIINVYQIFG